MVEILVSQKEGDLIWKDFLPKKIGSDSFQSSLLYFLHLTCTVLCLPPSSMTKALSLLPFTQPESRPLVYGLMLRDEAASWPYTTVVRPNWGSRSDSLRRDSVSD
jgi:hypothetical protein